MEYIITRKNGHKVSVLYDQCDHDLIQGYKWYVSGREGNQYPAAFVKGEKRKYVVMHRVILGISDPKIKVDHKNHNPFDNRRHNIRACTHQQNMFNLSFRIGYKTKGITYDKSRNRWKARIGYKSKSIFIGWFKTQELAAVAYNKNAQKLYGEFALLNQIPA